VSDPPQSSSAPRRFAIVIALLMATVSIISAVVANRAAFWSSTAGDLGGQALQEVLETQQIEDTLRTFVDADVRLIGRYDTAWKRSEQLQTQAAAMRADDPGGAAALDIEAQGEYGIDVALWRFFQVLFPTYDATGELVFDPDGALAAFRAGDVRLTELARSDAGALAGEARDRTTALVAIAAVFVASLFVLTLAEVTSGRRRGVAVVVGVTLASSATALAVLTDVRAGALVISTALAAVAVIAAVVGGPWLVRRWRAGRVAAQEAESSPSSPSSPSSQAALSAEAAPLPEAIGAPDPTATTGWAEPASSGSGQPSTRFAGGIGVLLAGATLLGAVVGYLQGIASDRGDDAARDARDQAMQALVEHQRTNQWATIQVEQWTRVLEGRARVVMARQAADYWTGHGDPKLAALDAAEADQHATLVERAARLTQLSAGHPDGPDADPDFPLRFYAAQGEQTARRVVLQDLANEANAHYGAVSAGHVAVLATIAIAAYLLGLSLVLDDRRSQRLFALVGGSLLAVSAGWAAWNELGAPPGPDAEQREAIAAAYARASVTAATARFPAQWMTAESQFREALALHPSLSRARVGLAGAIFMAASPQMSSGFTSVSSIEAVRAAAAELETARARGWENVSTLGDGGFYETLLALDEPGGEHAAKAVELTAAALERAPELPVVRYNHGAALLVDGRIDEARAAYQAGIEVSMAPGPAGTPVLSAGQRWRVAAGALTDLELIEASLGQDPVIGPAIGEIRTLVVEGLGDPIVNHDPATQPAVSDLRVQSNASELWWLARIDGFDAARDVASVVWSYEDPVVPGRHVLDTHSGPIRLGSVTDAGSFYIDGEAPDYWSGRSYLLGSTPQRCVPDGSYQVDLYINGRLAAEASADIDQEELVTVSRRDMGILFCRPADWVVEQRVDGSKASFRSADGSMGLSVVRVFRPAATDEGQRSESLQVMDELMAGWPGDPQATPGDPVSDYFMGLRDASVQWYDTPDTRIKVVTGVDSLGTVFAAAIHGPSAWVDGTLANAILGSFSTQ
jgi:hypothetical protein